MCGDHRRPQTLAEMCRNIDIYCGLRSVATRVKYPGSMKSQKVVSKMGPGLVKTSLRMLVALLNRIHWMCRSGLLLNESALGDCKLLNRTPSYYEILFLTRPPANPHVIQRFMRPAAEMSKVWALTTIFESTFNQGYRQKEADSHILKWSL